MELRLKNILATAEMEMGTKHLHELMKSNRARLGIKEDEILEAFQREYSQKSSNEIGCALMKAHMSTVPIEAGPKATEI